MGDQPKVMSRQIVSGNSHKTTDNEKNAFFASMSHNMRAPMKDIMGLIHASQEEEALPDSVRDNLKQMEDACNHLMDLTNDILIMSRIEGNSFRLYLEPVSLYQVYASVLENLKPFSDERQVEIYLYKDELEDDILLLDRSRVQQILYHILSNAVKYSPRGGKVEVLVRCIKRDTLHMILETIVADNGIGMEDDFLPHIFEPFVQEDNGINEPGVGTGMGMAIAKKLVDMMEGDIRVTSKKGEGTTFVLTIPYEYAGKANMKSEESSVSFDKAVLKGKRILLCEDEEKDARSVEEMLKQVGCIVELAENGKKGIELYESSPEYYYDYILMDIRMPLFDGLTTTREIRSDNRCDSKRIPIIAMAASAFDKKMARAKDTGFNDFLAKPLVYEQLCEMLERHLK